jgi:hypothetical protein
LHQNALQKLPDCQVQMGCKTASQTPFIKTLKTAVTACKTTPFYYIKAICALVGKSEQTQNSFAKV